LGYLAKFLDGDVLISGDIIDEVSHVLPSLQTDEVQKIFPKAVKHVQIYYSNCKQFNNIK